MTTSQLASTWRKQNGYEGRGGVVILYRGEVMGWCNELRNPEHWRPGCTAVDEAGQQWGTVGGNDRDGSTEWRQITLAA